MDQMYTGLETHSIRLGTYRAGDTLDTQHNYRAGDSLDRDHVFGWSHIGHETYSTGDTLDMEHIQRMSHPQKYQGEG